MHEILVFNSSSSASSPGGEVERVMTRLAVRMAAFQRSTEYVQDYIDMAGLKLWQQELSRVIYYNIEQVRQRPTAPDSVPIIVRRRWLTQALLSAFLWGCVL